MIYDSDSDDVELEDYREDERLAPPTRPRRPGRSLDLTNMTLRVVLTGLLVGLSVLAFFLLIRPRGVTQPEPTPTVLAAQSGTPVLPTFTPGPTATAPPTATTEAVETDVPAGEEGGEGEATAEAPITGGELAIGGQAIIANTDNLGVRVRSGPGLNFATLVILAEGSRVTILDGPREADELSWWQIELEDATTGWAASDFLSPVAVEGE